MHNRRPEDERRDRQFKPLRNRFKPLCQRRVDINTATVGDLMERIPGVGKEKGPPSISVALAYRKQEKDRKQQLLFSSLDELCGFLREVKGVGPVTSEHVCCFVTCYGRRQDVHSMLRKSHGNVQ